MIEAQGNGKCQSVMITGGNGLVGKHLTSLLLAEGYKVSHLSRRSDSSGEVKIFRWDPAKGYLSPEAFEGIDYLIHLAGANLGEKRWTDKRKEEIITSRATAARFLYRVISENRINLRAFITASAVGYYGTLTSDRIFTEEDQPADDFLGTVCRLWEEGADLFRDKGIRTVKIRAAVVLAGKEGVLGKLMNPARFGLAVRLGSGAQYFPWIHIDDLCNIYLKAIRDLNMHGAYNAAAPEHITHTDFIKTMARVMNRPLFLPPVPGWLLKAIMGEMAGIVIEGSRVSCRKIIDAGYSFRFEQAEAALKNIILA